MKLVSAESLRRPEVVRWHNRLIERHTPPPGVGLTILLPCSGKKPYSKSKSHMKFKRHIRKGAKSRYSLVHEVILTSPLGLVPRELEEVYPAAHYDVPVTGFWSREEKDITTMLIKDYMVKSDAPVIAYGEGAYLKICEEAGVEGITDDLVELERLVFEMLKGREARSRIPERLKKVRAICDFQFGKDAWKRLLGKGSTVKGFQVIDETKALLATIDRGSGFLALSLLGAQRLFSYGRHIAVLSFKPESNSIFCAGIEKADHVIRPKDEVIAIYSGEVVGVGRANLSGIEMERASKGLGLTLRHRRKKADG